MDGALSGFGAVIEDDGELDISDKRIARFEVDDCGCEDGNDDASSSGGGTEA